MFFDKERATQIVRKLKRSAARSFFNGQMPNPHNQAYLKQCSYKDDFVSITFTKDAGAHSYGWWKNPDYERCYHLSITKDGNILQWLDLFFGEHKTKIWSEPPYSPQGKNLDIWHFRLFCDENWQPIMPRKEVYSKDFTPKDWKSFSEVNSLKNQGGL